MRLLPTLTWVLFLLVRFEGHSELKPPTAWPQFRGPSGSGIANRYIAAPVHFGPNSNVLWKTALPAGNSSPCIYGDRIFLTGHRETTLETLCLDRMTGKVLWRRTNSLEKIEPTHRIGSPATPTPATDGKSVFVYFGSIGLIAYNFKGNEIWRKPLPAPVVEFGSSSSPVLSDRAVIQLCDQDTGSYLLAVDKNTGKTLWRTERPEFPRGFGTPVVWQSENHSEVIVPGTLWLKSYHLEDGRELWSVLGQARVVCTTPIIGDKMIYAASWTTGGDFGSSRLSMESFDSFAATNDRNKDGLLTKEEVPAGPLRERFNQIDFDKDKNITPLEWRRMEDIFNRVENQIIAIKPGGRGDVTASHVVWKKTRGLPYVPSPLYYQGRIYTVKNGGLASCFDAGTGKEYFLEERIGPLGDFYASPIVAGGKIYAASQDGEVVVFEAADQLRVLSRQKMGESIMATPAIVDGKLYLRTTENLYAFGTESPIKSPLN